MGRKAISTKFKGDIWRFLIAHGSRGSHLVLEEITSTETKRLEEFEEDVGVEEEKEVEQESAEAEPRMRDTMKELEEMTLKMRNLRFNTYQLVQSMDQIKDL